MAKADFEAIVAKIMGGVDVKDALAVLEKRGLPAKYSDAAAQQLLEEANKLADRAAKLKKQEAPHKERQAIRDELNRVLIARDLLYKLRGPQPGDVTVGVPAAGSPE